MNGIADPFVGTSWSINGADSADNQDVANSFITTSGILPASTYPQFTSWAAARYDRPGGPFDPHTGDHYVYSQIADVSYKQLTRTVDVPAGGGELSFWTSYDTEADWDYLFVEARTAGGTQLDDAPGPERQHEPRTPGKAARRAGTTCIRSSTTTRRSTARACTSTGTTGAWNAAPARPAAGSSGGSTWAPGPAGRSRSRSRTPPTGRPRGSASSSTTSSRRRAQARPRSRRTQTRWTAGRRPGRRRGAPPTRTTGSGRPRRASPRGPSWPRRLRTSSTRPSTWASASRAIDGAVTRANVMGRAMDHLLDP